ncbi:FAD/NAD(P)-binding domain-containing protein [Pleomassaria siparia CBS 279.74]|uniref:FAD/NAD(P)-binding domain-containing protein n=1 Tax=Pleomassaria siparia CBS 279.74 TaxID=1314801 RepID=A0A6G1KG51_9PLEO|nr:FAD/NAD(P)-binding domain-containing protein [Pleomassaria siparia CBS 279.74]
MQLSHLHQLPLGMQVLTLPRSNLRGVCRVVGLTASCASRLSHDGQQRRCLTIQQADQGRQDRQRVVILGSGWAGYTVARQLDSKKYQAVVVSPRSYFAFTPLLASTSVGTLEFRTALEPVRSRRSNVGFFQGWADAVDFKNGTVTIEEAIDDQNRGLKDESGKEKSKEAKQVKKGKTFALSYDKLVITVGCYSQTFNTPGIREHALFLKDVADARKIRNRILACFEAAALPTTSDEMRKVLLNFAVVGGGPTGIEFGAELHDLMHEDLVRIYPELIPLAKITVYDVSDKVLPMFDEKLAKYCMETFRREGIAIKTQHHVEGLRPGPPKDSGVDTKECAHDCFTLQLKEEGEVGVGMVVWSTGLMNNPFVAKALRQISVLPENEVEVLEGGHDAVKAVQWEVKKDARSGSIMTDDRLRMRIQAQGDATDKSQAILKNVFALGDCAILEGTTYPATAQVASQKAMWLAKRLNKNDIEKSAGFSFKNLGVMAYIGSWNAVVQGGSGGNVSGRAAWILWRGAYLTKSVSIRNKILIPMYWFLNWIFGRDISRF